jgi:hypothetical protein
MESDFAEQQWPQSGDYVSGATRSAGVEQVGTKNTGGNLPREVLGHSVALCAKPPSAPWAERSPAVVALAEFRTAQGSRNSKAQEEVE